MKSGAHSALIVAGALAGSALLAFATYRADDFFREHFAGRLIRGDVESYLRDNCDQRADPGPCRAMLRRNFARCADELDLGQSGDFNREQFNRCLATPLLDPVEAWCWGTGIAPLRLSRARRTKAGGFDDFRGTGYAVDGRPQLSSQPLPGSPPAPNYGDFERVVLGSVEGKKKLVLGLNPWVRESLNLELAQEQAGSVWMLWSDTRAMAVTLGRRVEDYPLVFAAAAWTASDLCLPAARSR